MFFRRRVITAWLDAIRACGLAFNRANYVTTIQMAEDGWCWKVGASCRFFSYSVIFMCHHEQDTWRALIRMGSLSEDQEYVHPSSAKMWRRFGLEFSSTMSVV